MQNNNKELLDKVATLQQDTDDKVKSLFNLKSLFYIILAVMIGVIAALGIVFLIIYYLQ